MWWNIFIIVFGCIIAFVVGAYALDSLNSYSNSKGELKKAWKRAFEGWIILFLFIMFGVVKDIFVWLTN
jgi:undecaprenyl pyrophosphate phosphatase UppP